LSLCGGRASDRVCAAEDDDGQQPADEANMFVLSWDRFNPAGVDPTGPEVKIAWRVRWMVDVQRLLVVYVPDVRAPSTPSIHPSTTHSGPTTTNP
jgi:hypothetical protein